jgi:quinol monooxygenase YgiN
VKAPSFAKDMWTMRKLAFLPIALTLTALPTYAQTPAPQHGFKQGSILIMFTGEVLPGQMDKFKQVVTRVVAAVAEEPGTLINEWSFQPDQKTYNVLEAYQDSEAFAAHVKHISTTDFSKELGQVRKTLKAVVFGTPNSQVKEALARLEPIYTSPIDGFIR